MDLLSVLTPYEASIVETVDDVELFAWWHETRGDPVNKWARLLPEDLGVSLFDAGLRCVEDVAVPGAPQYVLLKRCVGLEGFRPPLWDRVMMAAQAWEPWPEAFRAQLAAQHSLRYRA